MKEKKQTVWVTGGSKGIGLATANLLAEKGYQVIASSRRFSPDLHGDVNQINMDLSDLSSIAYTQAEVKSKFGKIDVLINNAGLYLVKPTLELTETDFDSLFDTNVKGALFLTKSVLPGMIEAGYGRIINVNSIASEKVFPNAGLYSATKSALLSLSSSLREEVRQHGIDIIDILPGATITDAWDKESIEKFSDKMMRAEDVAESILELILLSNNKRLVPEKLVIRPKSGDL